MKNVKEIGLSLLLTFITGTGLLMMDTYKNTIDDLNNEIANKSNQIKTLETDIGDLIIDNLTMESGIIELDSKVIKLSNDVSYLEKKLNKEISNNKISKTKVASGQLMTFEATAYSGDPITATGTVPKVGRTIAVDPRVIPYGSKVYIEGMGTFIAEDCGGAIKGNIIDIFMGSKEECRAWGRRKVQIKVL